MRGDTASTKASAIVRRDIGHDGRSHAVAARRHSKDRSHGHRRHHRHGTAASLVQLSQELSFPAYPRAESYAHPLDAAGQELEKKAVAQLSPSSVMGHLNELVGFPTRSYSNAQASQKVEDYLKHTFESMGLTTCFHSFKDEEDDPDPSVTFTNVVAYVPGTDADTITVGAHYDSRPFIGNAPGAEDNGSGVASLLAIAKAFSDNKIKPKSSVYFVAFAGEEPGLVGSKFFASALHGGGGSIPSECRASSSFLQTGLGRKKAPKHQAIIMDEVGWASPKMATPTVNLESFDWTKPLMDHLRESCQTHNGDALAVVHNAHPFGSDHMSFLDNNMMAVLTINGDDEAYPNYHKSSDTIDNVSPDLLSMITKMNMGALLRTAGVESA